MTEFDLSLRFAAALSYRASTPEGISRQKSAIAEAVASGLDCDALYLLVERHRIHAIALAVLEATAMEGVIGHRLGDLRKSATASRQQSLVLAMRGEQARRAIERAGVTCLAFKGGPNLSRKLYGDIALRFSKDVDLIVHPEDLATAFNALKSEGWSIDVSPVWFTSPLHRALSRHALRDLHIVDPSTRCLVELHTRFEVVPDLVLETAWWQAFESTGSQDLSDAEFLYLVHHGTKHLWSLMKWLGDIAAIAESQPDLVERSVPLARELRLEKMFAPLAVLLRDLYGIELPGYAMHADQGGRLAANCIASLKQKNTWRMNQFEIVAHFQFMNRFRHLVFGPRVSLIRRILHLLFSLLIRPKDIEAMGPWLWVLLPFLPLVRVGSLLWRYTAHAIKLLAGRDKK